jgi:hypothetical protein
MADIPKPPIGAVSAAILVALDSVWGAGELGAAASVVGSVGIPFMMASVGALCFVTVTFLQRFTEGDSWGAAVAKGLACGVLAGLPFPVMGTGAGAILLGWLGLHRLGGGESKQLPPPRS